MQRFIIHTIFVAICLKSFLITSISAYTQITEGSAIKAMNPIKIINAINSSPFKEVLPLFRAFPIR
jgi:cytochrome bd-type quinol oxidase subunit 1